MDLMIDKIFSDHNKTLKILVSGLIITVSSIYSYDSARSYYPDLEDYLRDQDKYDGQFVELGYLKVVGDLAVNNFELRDDIGDTITVKSRGHHKLESGDVVSLQAIFRKGSEFTKGAFLDLIELHVHKNQGARLIVSILAAIIIIYLFSRRYEFNSKKLTFEMRSKDA